MATSVIAPFQPPRHDDPEALIEEARRRTRLRRFAYAAAALLALVIAAGVWGGLALTNGSTRNGSAPPGFHLVQASGKVEHELIETRGLLRLNTVDLATGRQRPTRRTAELWLDARSGLARVVVRQDGRVRSDQVVPCNPTRYGSCAPGFSFAFDSTIDSQNYVRDPGTYRFHGRDVIWAGKSVRRGFGPTPGEGERVGIDLRTHQPIAYTYLEHGEVVSESRVTKRLKDVAAHDFVFSVPDGGIGHGFPRLSSPNPPTGSPERALLETRARRVLGRTPLWLGRVFEDRPIRSIGLGTETLEGKSGVLSAVPYVRYDYGRFVLQEYGSKRPTWYRQGPRPGQLVLERGLDYGGQGHLPVTAPTVEWAALSRDGVLVVASPSIVVWPHRGLTPARALRLVAALRAVPARP